MAVTALKPKNTVESLRDIVQDLLVPELKALKAKSESQRRENETHFAGIRADLAAVRTEVKITTESIRKESEINFGSVRTEIEALRVELRLRDEKQSQAIRRAVGQNGHPDGSPRAPRRAGKPKQAQLTLGLATRPTR